MISKEEIINRFVKIQNNEFGLSREEAMLTPEIKLINDIYESVGTCKDCAYYEDQDLCPMYYPEEQLLDGYCNEFERLEP